MLCEFWSRHLGNTVSDWKIKNSWRGPRWLCFPTFGYPWRRSELHWWPLLRRRWPQQFAQFCWTSLPWQTPAALSQSSHQSCGRARAPTEGKAVRKWCRTSHFLVDNSKVSNTKWSREVGKCDLFMCLRESIDENMEFFPTNLWIFECPCILTVPALWL